MTGAQGDDPVWMTSAMLKAYSHPLRRRILKVLARHDHMRAADIAAELDVPANSVSFHLRTLADADLIKEAPEHARDRRDRVWTPVRGAMSVGDPEHPVADEELGGAVVQAIAAEHQDLLQRVVAWAPEYYGGRSPGIRAVFQQRTTRLTEAEFEALLNEFEAAFERAEAAHVDGDPDARFWQVDIVAADDTI
ncbi:transcriptional regulator [Microbacterium sp. 1.5R]|uniref:ArsR/SmtB family transcription factor n=1 Tax=Microbacterium sp. 1.5R TaxID=1916917 RepID=UPI0011A74773|nr:helix-turn-helix domain-containing protein [Microbacterium sp. 1.5R]